MLRLSTGLRNKMLGLQATVRAFLQGATGAFVDGGAGADTITDSGSGLVTAGFAPGQILFCEGATTAANDTAVTGAVIQGVVAGTITLETAIVDTAEAFDAKTIIAAAEGGSLKDVMRDGVLRIYSGSQPATADAAATGTLLVEVTVASGAFVAGAFGNGLEFGDSASAAIAKDASVWSGVGLAAGTAGWFRLCANATDAGALSTTLPRVDGSVGVSGADLNMSSTTIAVGATYTIDSFTLTLPAYYGATS